LAFSFSLRRKRVYLSLYRGAAVGIQSIIRLCLSSLERRKPLIFFYLFQQGFLNLPVKSIYYFLRVGFLFCRGFRSVVNPPRRLTCPVADA